MNIKLNKKDLDEAIRLERKYWQTGDIDLLPALDEDMSAAIYNEETHLYGLKSIVDGIAVSCPYAKNETFYKVLEILGYEIIDD